MDDIANPRTERFMREALDVARAGMERGELPVGALVVLDGQVIASAHTQEVGQRRLLVHAELLALEAADRLVPYPGKRIHAVLHSTLEPCLMCLGAAMSSFVGAVVYGLESPSDGAVSLVRGWERKRGDFPSYRTPYMVGGIMREESRALFQEYVARHPSGRFSDWARTLAAL